MVTNVYIIHYLIWADSEYGKQMQPLQTSEGVKLRSDGYRPTHPIWTRLLIITSLPNCLALLCTPMSQSQSHALTTIATPAVEDPVTPAGALIPNYGDRVVQNGPGMHLNLAFSAGGVCSMMDEDAQSVAKVRLFDTL
ncbi:hypothetical protein FIBSPDRAFT_903335 [Athelia psychrophila]|uniref:Uncharacterized protein n=1 Tax=Athelia psychrophila TaxID=1759441 RepID=A0A167W461_9AGAM|nr:hypothetical protein FIBSPDRAFT_903335 [Fibularhizoctonia sp. CBS 109695]